MTTLDIPSSAKFKESQFGLVYNNRVFTSPFSNARQVALLGGARWVATYTTRVYKANTDDAEAIKSFLMKLQGQFNDFNGYDPDYNGVRGVWSGAPLVAGASQTGNSLNIDGAGNSVTGWAKDGDYFVVNDEFKRINADADSNSSGEVTLTFDPPLRASPVDNATITFTSPRVRMRLADSDTATWNSGATKLQQFSWTAEELIGV